MPGEDQKSSEKDLPFFKLVEVAEGVMPEGVRFIVGDFTEFERAREERREVNWDAFVIVRDGPSVAAASDLESSEG